MKDIVIGLLVCLLTMGVICALDYIESPKGTNWQVFDEQEVWTGRVIFLPEGIEVKNSCRLWPVNEPLKLGGYWNYSTDLDQWIVCD